MGVWSLSLTCLILLVGLTSSVVSENGNSTAVKHSDRKGKALKISKKPCTDPSGKRGVCTFKWDCINGNGTLMGTCVDGFIFGTCCRYDKTPEHGPVPLQNGNEIGESGISETMSTTTTTTTEGFSTTLGTRTPVQIIKLTTPKPAVTLNTATSVGTLSSGPLVTWTSIGPTRAPQRPIILHPFPFRPGGVPFPSFQGGWPVGVAFPVDPFQTNRPLPQVFPAQLLNSQHTTLVTHAPARPTDNSSFTILVDGLDKTSNSTTAAHGIEMTTVSVPIPQWSTESGVVPGMAPSGHFSSSAQHSSAFSTGVPSRVPLDYRKDCGVRAVGAKARIVGGQSASFGRWPWQVLVKEAAWLGLYQKNKCGGVLVSSKYAITAGHCQPGRFLSALVVILGEYDLLTDGERARPEVRRVKRMIVHRHYNPQNFDNDIALLELDPPVQFRPHISPICLPDSGEDFTGRKAYVTGWGKTSHGGVIPNLLQEVRVPIMSNVDCLDMFRAAGHAKLIKDTFLCAGYKEGGKDSCEGDSGGPLMVERGSGQWVLVGTVSHGIRCADPNLPGVYMKISAYRSWINKIIG